MRVSYEPLLPASRTDTKWPWQRLADSGKVHVFSIDEDYEDERDAKRLEASARRWVMRRPFKVRVRHFDREVHVLITRSGPVIEQPEPEQPKPPVVERRF